MTQRKMAATIAASLFLAHPSFAQDPTTVREVQVEVDLTAITNPAAATYWTNVADDLENAIVARVTDRTDPDGVRISVDIEEVSLASMFENLTDTADTRMVGQVNITSDTDNTKFNSYELTVSIEEALPFMPPGTVITAIRRDTPEYYRAMVEAFADAVIRRL